MMDEAQRTAVEQDRADLGGPARPAADRGEWLQDQRHRAQGRLEQIAQRRQQLFAS